MLTALLLMTIAAPGDAIYLATPCSVVDGKCIKADPIILTTAQKLELRSAVAAATPDVKPADLDRYVCWSNPPQIENKLEVNLSELASSLTWPCYAFDANPADTDEEVFELELNANPNRPCTVHDKPGGGAYLQCEYPTMNADARLLNDAFTQSAFGLPLNLVWWMQCDRAGSDVACGLIYVKIASIATWRIDRKLGRAVGKPLGRVAP